MDKPTVQDIFHRFYPAYLDQYSPSPVQAKVALCATIAGPVLCPSYRLHQISVDIRIGPDFPGPYLSNNYLKFS